MLPQYLFKGIGGEMGKGCWWLSIPSGGAFGIHVTGSGGRLRMTFHFTFDNSVLLVSGPGNRGFQWLPTLGGGASGMHISE